MIKNISLIATNELRRMFKSPLAWLILAVVQFLVAIFFYWFLSQYYQPRGSSDGLTVSVVASMYQMAGVIILLVSPLITMRLLTEEHRLGTIKLLFSSPISITELVLGKYVGITTFYCLMLLMISMMPFSLLFGTGLDMGQIVSGLIGLLLLISAFASIGLFISSLTKQPALAATLTFNALFFLSISSIAGTYSSEKVAAFFSYLSLLKHYNNLLIGVFNTADVLFYILISVFFIILSIWRLDADRTYG